MVNPCPLIDCKHHIECNIIKKEKNKVLAELTRKVCKKCDSSFCMFCGYVEYDLCTDCFDMILKEGKEV